MPDRYLREAILRSERIGALSVGGVVLYYKLLSLVDDYGCFDGREMVITQLSGWRFALPLPLRELHEFDLIVRYLNAGKPFVALTQWGEARRGRRKWPAPPVLTDLPELDYAAPFNQPGNWKNPLGTERVSILLDLDGKPTDPQPREWRRTESDWMPRGAISTQKVHERKEKTRSTAQHTGAASGTSKLAQRPVTSSVDAARPSTLAQPLSVSVSSSSSSSSSPSQTASPSLQPDAAPPHEPPPPSALGQHTAPTTTTPPTNGGGIKLLDSGEWAGLSEAQRLRWQGMFASLSVPDQIDRAGAWLLAHHEERMAYEQAGEQEQFLIRWLLREAKAH